MGKRITYVATYTTTAGKTLTATRTSEREYTHASVVQWGWGDKEILILSFHGSEANALKGSLTGAQRKGGAVVLAAVPLTIQEKTPKAKATKPAAVKLSETQRKALRLCTGEWQGTKETEGVMGTTMQSLADRGLVETSTAGKVGMGGNKARCVYRLTDAGRAAQKAAAWRFEATCKCGGQITGDSVTWRHKVKPEQPCKAQAVGMLTQI